MLVVLKEFGIIMDQLLLRQLCLILAEDKVEEIILF